LIFPHHENEIAQSEAATGKRFVRCWFHNGWLLVNGKKMSKSLGNFYTLRDILKKSYDARAVRLELMSTHYRKELDFNFNSLNASVERIKRLDNFAGRLSQIKEERGTALIEEMIPDYKSRITNALDDDLNTPKAIDELFAFIREANVLIDRKEISSIHVQKILKFLREIDRIFGIMAEEKEIKIPKEIQKLARERESARKSKKFGRADELRDGIRDRGYAVEDTPEGPNIRKI